MKKDTEATIVYFPPSKLIEASDENEFPLTWIEMIQDIDLGDKEFRLLIGLSKKADMSIVQVILFFLHYWEGKTEEELGKMYKMSHMTISRELKEGRKKLYRPLKKLVVKKLA